MGHGHDHDLLATDAVDDTEREPPCYQTPRIRHMRAASPRMLTDLLHDSHDLAEEVVAELARSVVIEFDRPPQLPTRGRMEPDGDSLQTLPRSRSSEKTSSAAINSASPLSISVMRR